MRWPWQRKSPLDGSREDYSQWLENSSGLPNASTLARVQRKIQAEKPERKAPYQDEESCSKCLLEDGRTRHLNCPECYGYGILHRTRRRGPEEWWTCDFCGNVEPTINTKWIGPWPDFKEEVLR